ncbi:hypothetical protein FHX10_003443 [Rhizobium sp. BK591]|uniref:hypothetical protein n=1 Tax=Rhizobium sp. BK591 TaxID=2586985 RepID=UPI001609DB79|nr:hypothetical protein [Rhizobium sp. BK591]MBB3743944.1 hypothetical protein [Rhizobium sp. BK591]
MNITDVFKSSGSNIGPVLSATALAVTSTMSPAPALVEDQKPPIVARPYLAGVNSPTDVNFTLGLIRGGRHQPVATAQAPSHFPVEKQWRPTVPHLALPLGFLQVSRSEPSASLNASSRAQLAAEFYETLPSDARNEVLWDIVSLAFAVTSISPRVEVIDGMTTIDFDAPGRLLSILIDGDTLCLSAFSRQKELKMTYVAESDVPRDEFINVLWGQLVEFSAAVRA